MNGKTDNLNKDNMLTDEQLEQVTGGLNANFSYWLYGGDNDHCPDGSKHRWLKSSSGKFEYCEKCHAERYYLN